MFEICALLATKKTAKVRAPRGASIKAGAACIVYGRPGVVVGKDETIPGWWKVNVEGRQVARFHRSVIDLT